MWDFLWYTCVRYTTNSDSAPMTTSSKSYPTRVEIKHNNKIGWIVIDQIRTIDKQRIITEIGKMTKPEIKEVKAVLKETFVD